MTGLRLAVAGKGGAGKTTVSATLARLAARDGHATVVIDADSNPNVAVALGIDPERAGLLEALPTDLVSRRLDADAPALLRPLHELLDQFALLTTDGVHVVAMGRPRHAEEGCMCSAHAVVSGLLADSAQHDRLVIVDMEASPEHFGRGTTRHADALLIVVEPYYRSLETARRMAELAAELPIDRVGVVANKLRSTEDRAAIRQFCDRHDLALEGEVPWSDAVVVADRSGRALLDHAPSDPAVEALSLVLAGLLYTPHTHP